MKVPHETVERNAFFEEVIRKCFASRETRINNYTAWRQAYMYGVSAEMQNVNEAYRKLYAHTDLVTAFLYAQDTTKFTIKLGAAVPASEYSKVDKMAEILNDGWHVTNTDLLYGEGVKWSLVYGSMIPKLRWYRGAVQMHLIHPHNFGVLNEAEMFLDRQEAMAHTYRIGRSELARMIESHPNRAILSEQMSASTKESQPEGTGTRNIVISDTNPIMGNVQLSLLNSEKYVAKLAEEQVDMQELWLWDDMEDQFRVVTLADPGIVIYDRVAHDEKKGMRIFTKGEHPFNHICPIPINDYFWGMSEVELLTFLQNKYNTDIDRVERILKKQSNPSTSFIGFSGLTDELSEAFDSPGGIIANDMPGSKVEIHWPETPNDLFAWRNQIDMMFEEISGLPSSLKGGGIPGVRSESHANKMVQVGGSRVKKRALMIEDSLEDLATKMLKLHRMYDDEKYVDREGTPFLCQQFTSDFTAMVDAHSNSPIFVDDQRSLAGELLGSKSITRERFIEMVNAPNAALLKQELRDKIEPSEAKAEEQKLTLEQGKIVAQSGKDDPTKMGLLKSLLGKLSTAREPGK